MPDLSVGIMADLSPFCLIVITAFVYCACILDTLAAGSVLGELQFGWRFNWFKRDRPGKLFLCLDLFLFVYGNIVCVLFVLCNSRCVCLLFRCYQLLGVKNFILYGKNCLFTRKSRLMVIDYRSCYVGLLSHNKERLDFHSHSCWKRCCKVVARATVVL